MLAALVGWLLGSSVGVLLGGYLIPRLVRIAPIEFLQKVDARADEDDGVPIPQTAGQRVTFFKKRFLKDTSPWLVQPDFDRALFINNILTQLWIYLSPAIHKEVLKHAEAPLKDVVKRAKVLEDIRIDLLDLGTRPPRVDSFRYIPTPEDEVILEVPVFWGGDVRLRVTAVVKAGRRSVDVPVDVALIQIKALPRLTIKPLVERLPCVGGVAVSLMETPHFDMELRLADSPDLMALPGVPAAISAALHVVAGNIAVYPNEFELPLMPNFGLPPPPLGMLHVKVVEATGLSGSLFNKMTPFVQLEVRRGRPVETRTLPSGRGYAWAEALDLVVDDPAAQPLRVRLFDDDLLAPTLVGQAKLALKGSEFMANPNTPVAVQVQLLRPAKKSSKAAVGQVAAQGAAMSQVALVGASAAAAPASGGGGGGGAQDGAGVEKKRKGIFARLSRLKRGGAPSSDAASVASSPPPSPAVGRTASAGAAAGAAAAEEATEAVAGAAGGSVEPPAETPRTSPAAGPSHASPRSPRGVPTDVHVALEITFLPFTGGVGRSRPAKAPAPETSPAAAEATGGEAPAPAHEAPETPAITSVRRQLLSVRKTGREDKEAKGVVTLTIKSVVGLGEPTDSYVVATLYDPTRMPEPRIEFRTHVVLNEASPRFHFRTDFVNVSSASTLTAVVYEQPGLMDSLASLKIPGLGKAAPKALGKVRVPIGDVAVEGRIKDAFPLLEAETGEMHLTLEWSPVGF